MPESFLTVQTLVPKECPLCQHTRNSVFSAFKGRFLFFMAISKNKKASQNERLYFQKGLFS